jgi:hypothetical protein
MPQTMITTNQGARIIGATFMDRANAEKAVEALQEIGVSPLDIQVVVQLNTHSAQDLYATILSDRGFSRDDARRYDKLIRDGRTLVAVYDVVDPGPVIDVLDEYQAEFNPDGSRNVRDDVVGMTTGAVVGAAAFGTLGGAVAGPPGAALGAAAGAVLGGGSGAVIGKAAEHRK